MKEPNDYIARAIVKYTIVLTIALALSYLMTAFIFYVFCECFDLDIWSYKTSFGVWIVFTLVSGIRVVVEDKHV